MRLWLVLPGMVLALAACSSHPVTRATAEAPIVPLVTDEEASVASSNQPSEAQTAPPQKAAAQKRDWPLFRAGPFRASPSSSLLPVPTGRRCPGGADERQREAVVVRQ